MTPQSSSRGVHALVRRSATFLVAAVVVGGVPLVAYALTDEPAPRLDSPIPDLGASLEDVTKPVDDIPAPDAAVVEQTAPDTAVVEQTAPVELAVPVEVAPPGPSADQWAALRECEAGGDYSITNRSGKYRGAYQFDRSTWNSVAERHAPALVGVDPAAASPADQDAMALALYIERGARPWPHCGRHLN